MLNELEMLMVNIDPRKLRKQIDWVEGMVDGHPVIGDQLLNLLQKIDMQMRELMANNEEFRNIMWDRISVLETLDELKSEDINKNPLARKR